MDLFEGEVLEGLMGSAEQGIGPWSKPVEEDEHLFNTVCHTSYSGFYSQTVMTLTGTLN